MAALIAKLRRGFTTLMVLLVAATFGALNVQAQEWGEIANISSTMGVNANRICVGEASRGDIGCPTYAPTVSPTGNMGLTAGLTVNSVSLTTAGTTWGYLGSAASYIPNLNTNNISLSTINGVSVTNLGGSSPTNVPAFRAIKTGTQTITRYAGTKLTFDTVQLNTMNGFSTSTNRFQPTVAGNYLIQASAFCTINAADSACGSSIVKNGTTISSNINRASNYNTIAASSAIVSMNGTTDYVEAYGYTDTSPATIGASDNNTTFFQGSLLASGNGLISGTGASALSLLSDVSLASPATGQVLTYNGTSWVNQTPAASSLTTISGTTTMSANWPDALRCTVNDSGWGEVTLINVIKVAVDGTYRYRFFYDTSTGVHYDLIFNANGTYNGRSGFPASTTCDSKTITQLYAEGKAFNFIGNSGAGGGDLGDRLTSGTLSVTANSGTSIVSLSTGGTNWGYLGSSRSYLPTINTAAISATAVQISSNTAVLCGAGNAGTLRYNNSNTSLELCNGTGWQMMGVGIPAGTISAFASTTCPTGWSEYTPARGRFLRGIDNAAGNDPDGTRAPGTTQTDALQNITGGFGEYYGGSSVGGGYGVFASTGSTTGAVGGNLSVTKADGYNFDASRVVRTSSETRPKNVAVTFCQFNGTSNGWNNPLSGGSTVPGGSTGQIQYNTSGSFDANANLTWNNAAGLLTASNLTTGYISLTTTSTTWGYLGSTASYVPNLRTNAISATNISVSTINGVSVTNLGGASPTNVPAFRVNKNGTNQSISSNAWVKLTFSTKELDTYTNFNTGTSRFTPTVAGNYLFSGSAYCGASTTCWVAVFKNGVRVTQNGSNTNADSIPTTSTVLSMNGSTDYVELYGYSSGTSISGDNIYTHFSGSLLASGNGLVSGTGASALSGLTDVTLASPATGQVLTYNGTGWVNATPSATSVISGTTTMISGWPDAIVCNFTTPNWGVRIIPLSYAPWNGDGNGRYIYRFTDGAGTNTEFFGVVFNSNGTFFANDYQTPSGQTASASSCSNKSIAQLYASGQAFNFIGNTGAGGGALGDRLTSGTLSVTANSSSTTVSLTTAGTTWGYLGNNASYLPNLNTNNISLSTINGISVSALGGGASPTNVPSFRVYATTAQTVAASTWTKINFSTKDFDTQTNFDLGTGRFQPTVKGNYLFTAQVACSSGTASCWISIRKNNIVQSNTGTNATDGRPTTAVVIPMNGTTDYVEAWGYSGSTSFNAPSSGEAVNFSGSLLASGNGLISGTGAGVSAISSLTDVTLTSPVSNSLLVYDGSKWVNKLFQDTVSTSSMVNGWPDAIMCNRNSDGGTRILYLTFPNYPSDNKFYYRPVESESSSYGGISFASTGAYSTADSGAPVFSNCQKSISQLYASGQAFNFLGSNSSGSSAMGDRLTSGTLSVTANSSSTTVSLTTGGTTWGYLGSTASYLPNLNTNNISLSTINGISVSALGGSASPTNVPAFSAHKNGTNQTVTANTWTKLTLGTEIYDTYNNYDTGTSRFTPTVAGYYLVSGNVYCSSAVSCYAGVYKNGVLVMHSGTGAATEVVANVMTLVYMNGSSDYIELYGNTSGTVIGGNPQATAMQASLVASGNGLISGTGAGVSAMSSLTDVTLTSPVSSSLLVYDGSKWVNKLFQDTVSTSTMVTGWPDALLCTDNGGSPGPTGRQIIYWQNYREGSTNIMSYKWGVNTTTYSINFNTNGTYNGKYHAGNETDTTDCEGLSISQLYAAGKAFNFLGSNSSGSTAMGDRLTSGTLSVTANSSSTTVSLTTAGTTWGYLGSNASYLPNLNTNALTVNGLTITSSSLVSTTSQVAFRAHRNGSNQTISAGTWVKILFTAEEYDTNNNFDTGTSTFTATVAGKYQFNTSTVCSGGSFCYIALYKNGVNFAQNGGGNSYVHTSDIVHLNAGDTVEAYVQNTGGTAILGLIPYTNLSGALLNGGTGSAGGDRITAASGGAAVLAQTSTSVAVTAPMQVSGSINFANNPGEACNSGNYGSIKQTGGRLVVCRQ